MNQRDFLTPYARGVVEKQLPRPVNRQFEKIYQVKHRELQALVASGIPPAAAIKMATINGARALNVATTLGTIEPGSSPICSSLQATRSPTSATRTTSVS